VSFLNPRSRGRPLLSLNKLKYTKSKRFSGHPASDDGELFLKKPARTGEDRDLFLTYKSPVLLENIVESLQGLTLYPEAPDG
jgi:hypothetical protein